MGIDLFPFYARNILQLQQWFQDIQRNLETENYNSGDWLTAPNITSLTGTPTVTHYYHKFGKQVDIIVVINGTSQTSTSKIDNVPYKAKEYGIASVYNNTDSVLVGYATINKDTNDLVLPDWNVISKRIIIQGFYRTTGI